MQYVQPAIEDIVVIDDLDRFDLMIKEYTRAGVSVCFDTETTGLSFLDNKLITLQFQQLNGCPVVVDVRHWTPKMLRHAGYALDRLFSQVRCIGMNLTFDWKFLLYHCGVAVKKCYDVMLAEQCIRGLGKSGGESEGVSFSLLSIAEVYGVTLQKETRNSFIDMIKYERWNAPFSTEELVYMAQDVAVLEYIATKQLELIYGRNLYDVVRLENRTLPAVASIEYNGIHIYEDGWRSFTAEMQDKADKYEAEARLVLQSAWSEMEAKRYRHDTKRYEAWSTAIEAKTAAVKEEWENSDKSVSWGTWKKERMAEWRQDNPNPGQPKQPKPFNLGSPQMLLAALQAVGVPVESTGKDVLDDLPEGEYPVVDLLKSWRKAMMFPQKFGENLLKNIHPDTNRIHPTYIQIGASTGRMSCTNPPWQQIPAKGDGARLRQLVTAQDGNVLLTADFSNIELRILADLSGDKNMLDFFARDLDLHAETARMMFNLPSYLTKDEIKVMKHPKGFKYRDAAKTINFGLVYGMSAVRLAKALKISKEDAQELMQKYFEIYSGAARWLETQRKLGVKNLYSVTVAGRKRYYSLPAPTDPDYKRLKASVERKSMNTPIQGSSADITKLAMALFYERVQSTPFVKLVAVVHDEIVVEAAKAYADEAAKVLAASMDEACTTYLKRVHIPKTVVSIAEAWEKA